MAFETIDRAAKDVVLSVQDYSRFAYRAVANLFSPPVYWVDFLMQAEAGLMSLTGEPDGPPARFGPSIIDYMTGTMSMVGLLACMLDARRSGRGCDVDVSLYDVALHQLGYAGTWYMKTGSPLKKNSFSRPTNVSVGCAVIGIFAIRFRTLSCAMICTALFVAPGVLMISHAAADPSAAARFWFPPMWSASALVLSR